MDLGRDDPGAAEGARLRAKPGFACPRSTESDFSLCLQPGQPLLPLGASGFSFVFPHSALP